MFIVHVLESASNEGISANPQSIHSQQLR